jgi:ABC-2 type transport system ATP-binding protein
MNSCPPVIRVEGISKSYPSGFWRRPVKVLSDLSFSVARNEVVGFLGPNGAGKTSTIKILTRLSFPDSGRVEMLGEPVGAGPEISRRIGFMPEHPYFYDYLTGNEFMALCGRLSGIPNGEIAARSREMMVRVGLESAGKTAIRKYSKGMMQRLGLAQALVHDPELVILDEPMSGLDPMGRMEVRNLIRELKDGGKTVFFSSHIITDVETLCDRVVMILNGCKVAEGTVEELLGQEVKFVELVFSPSPTGEGFDGAGIVQNNALVVRVPDYDEAERLVERARAAGGRLRSMVPVKRNLEDMYVEQVASGTGRGGKA